MAKKYVDGGAVLAPQNMNTYPYTNTNMSAGAAPAGGAGSGVNQPFGVQPQMQPQLPRPGIRFKKGGSVSRASKRADGCCVRGKTRA